MLRTLEKRAGGALRSTLPTCRSRPTRRVYPDGDYLYSFATLGQKIDWMREHPKVCVDVEDVSDRFQWTTVVVYGRYEELMHTDHSEAFREGARQLFRGRPEWWQPAAMQTTSPDFRMPVIYRIRIDRMTGRFGSRRNAGREIGKTSHP